MIPRLPVNYHCRFPGLDHICHLVLSCGDWLLKLSTLNPWRESSVINFLDCLPILVITNIICWNLNLPASFKASLFKSTLLFHLPNEDEPPKSLPNSASSLAFMIDQPDLFLSLDRNKFTTTPPLILILETCLWHLLKSPPIRSLRNWWTWI